MTIVGIDKARAAAAVSSAVSAQTEGHQYRGLVSSERVPEQSYSGTTLVWSETPHPTADSTSKLSTEALELSAFLHESLVLMLASEPRFTVADRRTAARSTALATRERQPVDTAISRHMSGNAVQWHILCSRSCRQLVEMSCGGL
jgi:hypothetical protein